jgi:hypothetical protein
MSAPGTIALPMDWGFKVCLLGPMGSGKTHSLQTLLDPQVKEILGHELEVFAIFTEPSPMNVLRPILPKIHWRYLPPATGDWKTLEEIGGKVNTLSNQQLQGLPKSQAGSYPQFVEVIRQCNNFIDHEGKSFGDVAKFNITRVLWIDSLTGLNKMAKKLVAGSRPLLTMPDWGVGMEMLQGFIDALTCNLRCHFVMCAHVEYGEDNVTGTPTMKLLISTLGKRLAPVLPTTFSDVVLTSKETGKDGASFHWSTAHPLADLRNTYLPINSNLEASFVPVLRNWKTKTQ